MSLAIGILMLIGMWVSVAAAMLWGVMRILRRHHPHASSPPGAVRRQRRPASAH